MKNVALFDENGSLAANVSLGGKLRPEAIIVSPLDVHTYIVAIPRLKPEQISGAVRYRLRALHPGNPDTARVDYINNGADTIIAFVTDSKIEERYKSTGLRALTPAALIRKIAPKEKGKWIGLFCTNQWIEATLLDGTEILAIEAITAGSYETDRIQALLKSIAVQTHQEELPVKTLVVPGLSPDAVVVADALRTTGMVDIEMFDIAKLTSRSFEDVIFQAPQKRRIIKGGTVALLVALDLILAVAAIHRIAAERERELESMKASYATLKTKFAETEAAVHELEEFEKKYSAYVASRPIDAYATIGEIYRCVGTGAWIKDMVIRNNTFAIEAEGTDALAVLARFNVSPRFSSVTLHQAAPSTEKGEAFSISGKIRDDR